MNSASESGVNYAKLEYLKIINILPTNLEYDFLLLVNLNETLVVLFNGELIVMLSSGLGSNASKRILYLKIINFIKVFSKLFYFHLPPDFLIILNSIKVLNGFNGSNLNKNSIGSPYASSIWLEKFLEN